MHLAPRSSIAILRFDLPVQVRVFATQNREGNWAKSTSDKTSGILLGTRRSVRELSRFEEDVNPRQRFSFFFPELRRIQLQNKLPTFDGLNEMK